MRNTSRRRIVSRRPRAVLELRGRVVRGAGLGRMLGYPTANLDRHYFTHHPVPNGVYAGWTIIGARAVRSAAVVGVDGKVEVHLLGWRGSVYGRRLTVRLIKFLRPLRSFRSAQTLRRQIVRDIAAANRFFATSAAKRLRLAVKADKVSSV